MRKNLLAIGGLALLIVVTIVGHSIPSESDVEKHIIALESAILAEQWNDVSDILNEIENEWKRRKFWISMNNAKDDLEEFQRTLTRLSAYLRAEDKPGAAAQAATLKEIWTSFAG